MSARLTFADAVRINTDDEVTTVVGEYIAVVNPKVYEKPRMQSRVKFETLDGPGGYQFGGYNPMIREFVWDSLPSQQAYKDLVTQLRTYRGRKIFVKEGSTGTDKHQEWQPIMVINVEPKYTVAPGTKHYYKSVSMLFVLLPYSQHSFWNAFYHPYYVPEVPQGGKPGNEQQMEEP